MLEISKISTSALDEEQWLANRVGKLTASDVGKLMVGESWKGKFSKGALTYLDGKVQENITGQPYKAKFETEATLHGNATEPIAIEAYLKQTGNKALRNEERNNTQHLIIHDELSSCTPDILVYEPHITEKTLFDSTGTRIKVFPCEIKCPPSDVYLTLCAVKTPEELKKECKMYYWQVLKQMLLCSSMVAHFYVYSEKWDKERNVVQFRKPLLVDDLKSLVLTLDAAKQYIKTQVQKQKQVA